MFDIKEDNLSAGLKILKEETLNVIQNADEIGGAVHALDYVTFMHLIATECMDRAQSAMINAHIDTGENQENKSVPRELYALTERLASGTEEGVDKQIGILGDMFEAAYNLLTYDQKRLFISSAPVNHLLSDFDNMLIKNDDSKSTRPRQTDLLDIEFDKHQSVLKNSGQSVKLSFDAFVKSKIRITKNDDRHPFANDGDTENDVYLYDPNGDYCYIDILPNGEFMLTAGNYSDIKPLEELEHYLYHSYYNIQ